MINDRNRLIFWINALEASIRSSNMAVKKSEDTLSAAKCCIHAEIYVYSRETIFMNVVRYIEKWAKSYSFNKNSRVMISRSDDCCPHTC